jgi:two-component system chemotaxis response regulator CheY
MAPETLADAPGARPSTDRMGGARLPPAVKILVVDDDADLNRVLSRYLEKSGYEVHSAGDALQALDVIGRVEGIGLVIADLVMPHLDGLGLIQMLKADPQHRNLPIILISGHPDDKKIDESLRKGAAFFLPKPIDFNRLLALVKFAE